MIDLSEKKRFLNWLIQSVKFKSRESYWIINYFINHETMLNKVVFVEDALLTPRGLIILDENVNGIGIEMSKQGVTISDATNIFHEIRMNRKEMLYLEVKFIDMYKTKEYLSVVETNEYQPIDESLKAKFSGELDNYFITEDIKYQLTVLEDKIDMVLEEGNESEFLKLSSKYKELKKAIISN